MTREQIQGKRDLRYFPVDPVEPARLSRELRSGNGPYLANRSRVVALSVAAAASMGVISLYQTGVIRHLPEPPLPLLDADKVDGSAEAYSYFSTPDGTLGLVSYGVTAVLAAMGGADRARRAPWIPVALAVKATGDAAFAAKLTVDQWTKHRAFCSYCLAAAACTFAILPLTLPEAGAALRMLRSGK